MTTTPDPVGERTEFSVRCSDGMVAGATWADFAHAEEIAQAWESSPDHDRCTHHIVVERTVSAWTEAVTR